MFFRPVFQGLPALLLLCFLYWLPESPRWLMLRGRHDEARRTLLKLHIPEEADIEYTQILAQTEIDKTLEDSYWAMFSKPSYRKRTLIGMGTFAAIQTSGILVINSKASFLKHCHNTGNSLANSYRLRSHGEFCGCLYPTRFRADTFTIDLRWPRL